EGTASAVLLRAGRVVEGEDLARARRTAPGPGGRDLARGPARLCQALAITRAQNGADVCDPASPLRVRWPAAAELGPGPAGGGGGGGGGGRGGAGGGGGGGGGAGRDRRNWRAQDPRSWPGRRSATGRGSG